MATTALDEEKKKAAIAAQAGTVIPNAAPLRSQGVAVFKAGTPASAPEKPAPSLNAPWYSREYAAAANMSDKGGLELERMRAAGANGIPQNDPARRLITTGTISTGQPQPIQSNEGRNAPTPAQVQKPSVLSVVSAPAQQASPQQSAQQPIGQQSMQPAAPQQAPNTVNGRDVGLTAPDNGFRAYPAERGFNFDKFQPQSGEGAFRNEQTGQVTRLTSLGVAQPVQQASGMRVITGEPRQVQQAQPARRPVNMPAVGQGMGVFSSMANFANQAGKAMGAAMQNRASSRAAKAGLDAFRVQDEASTNDLRRQTAQAELARAGQLDAARQEYLAAGDDPAKQKAAAKKLAVLSGKDGQRDNLKDNFIVVGGGQEYDQAAQTMRNVPQTLVDLRTGQPVALPAQQAQAGAKAAPQFVEGGVYPRTLKDGKTVNVQYVNGKFVELPQ